MLSTRTKHVWSLLLSSIPTCARCHLKVSRDFCITPFIHIRYIGWLYRLVWALMTRGTTRVNRFSPICRHRVNIFVPILIHAVLFYSDCFVSFFLLLTYLSYFVLPYLLVGWCWWVVGETSLRSWDAPFSRMCNKAVGKGLTWYFRRRGHSWSHIFIAGRRGHSPPVGFLFAKYWFKQISCRLTHLLSAAYMPLSQPLQDHYQLDTYIGTIVSEILFETQFFSFMKMHLKISSAIWRPFCPVGRWVNVAPLVPQKCLPASSVSSSCKEMTSSCIESVRPTCRHMNLKAACLILASKLSSHPHFPHREPLVGESTNDWWIPLTRAVDAKLSCLLCCCSD